MDLSWKPGISLSLQRKAPNWQLGEFAFPGYKYKFVHCPFNLILGPIVCQLSETISAVSKSNHLIPRHFPSTALYDLKGNKTLLHIVTAL